MPSTFVDVAYHEAGHAAIAVDEGIGLGNTIWIRPTHGYCHFAKDFGERTSADPLYWGPKCIKALLAGQISQEQYVITQGLEILPGDWEGWEKDNVGCYQIATEGMGLDASAASTAIARLGEATRSRVSEPHIWAAIRAIARRLWAQREMLGQEAEVIFHGICKK